jgi:hypothetical protein
VKILSRSWTQGPFKEEMPSKHDCTSELDDWLRAEEEIKRKNARAVSASVAQPPSKRLGIPPVDERSPRA